MDAMTREEAVNICRELRLMQRRTRQLRRLVAGQYGDHVRLAGRAEGDLECACDALGNAVLVLEIWHEINDEAELPEEQNSE